MEIKRIEMNPSPELAQAWRNSMLKLFAVAKYLPIANAVVAYTSRSRMEDWAYRAGDVPTFYLGRVLRVFTDGKHVSCVVATKCGGMQSLTDESRVIFPVEVTRLGDVVLPKQHFSQADKTPTKQQGDKTLRVRLFYEGLGEKLTGQPDINDFRNTSYHTGGYVPPEADCDRHGLQELLNRSSIVPGVDTVAESPIAVPEQASPALDLSDLAQEFTKALRSNGHPYHSLATTLLGAFEQAAMGKGKERHANDLPFVDQKILRLPAQQGHPGGLIYQVAKKALESERMAPDARIRELNGVIVYASAAIIFTEGQQS